MDLLSDVLQMVRLQGALFLHGEFHEPWCVDTPPAEQFARPLAGGEGKLAILHLVLEGRCWAQMRGGEPVPLRAGDVVALPHGDAHLIGSGLRHAPVQLQHVVNPSFSLAPLRYGGDGDGCVLACGWFAFERDVRHPMLAGLPAMFRSSVGARPAAAWIAPAIRLALAEAHAGVPGSGVMAARVAEALFVETLRAYLEEHPAAATGWLAASRDAQVGRCIALMHEKPAHGWTIESLAQEVHVSRSVLAERFTTLMGVPPMQYLKSWRLASAARMLASGRVSLLEVAGAVGYGSEAAFSRAFKAEYAMSPGEWRRQKAGNPPGLSAR